MAGVLGSSPSCATKGPVTLGGSLPLLGPQFLHPSNKNTGILMGLPALRVYESWGDGDSEVDCFIGKFI